MIPARACHHTECSGAYADLLMAISFSRPDPSSPTSVASAAFTTSRKGFEQAEVREFLRMVAAELARLQERERFLERELRQAQRASNPASIALDEEMVTRMLGEEAARILQAARDASSQIRTRSEESAARLLREANDEAQRLREEIELETARRRADATADAEAEVEMAKQQGREMVNEARAYRERVLGELSRRREMARQQIEQLVHGRDRLLNAFERARIAAVDVMADLTPLGEPNEYVNLSPTTGPVPLMMPNTPRPATTPTAPRTAPGADADPTVALVAPIAPSVRPVSPVDADAAVVVEVVEVGEVVEVVEVGGETDLDADVTAALAVSVTDTSADVTADITADITVVDTGDTSDTIVHIDIVRSEHADDRHPSSSPVGEPTNVVSLFADGRRSVPAETSDDTSADQLADDLPADDDDATVVLSISAADVAAADIDDLDDTATDIDDTSTEIAHGPVADAALDDRQVDERTVADIDSLDQLDGHHSSASGAKRSADDLFARLRAARAESVAHRASMPAATTTTDATAEVARIDDVAVDDVAVDDVAVDDVAVDDVASSEPPPAAIAPTDPDERPGDSVFRPSAAGPESAAVGDDTPFARRDEVLTPLIVTAARKLKRVLADEQNDVLHALRSKDPIRSVESMVSTTDQQISRYSSAVLPDLTTAAVAGAVSMGPSLADAQRMVEAAQAASPALALLASEIIEPLRARLERCVSDADGDNVETSTLVRLAYREWKSQRIDEQLDDIARTAFGHGALAGLAPGTPICWKVDPQGPDCADAEDNALGGVIAAGSPFPTDHRCAPAHNGCRCMIVRADG